MTADFVSDPDLHSEIRSGMWVALNKRYPNLMLGLAHIWFDLPAHAEMPFIEALLRVIDRVSNRVVTSYDPERFKSDSFRRTRSLADKAAARETCYRFKRSELRILLAGIEARAYPDNPVDPTDEEKRLAENYRQCFIRLAELCAWLELSLAGTDAVLEAAPAKRERPKLSLVR